MATVAAAAVALPVTGLRPQRLGRRTGELKGKKGCGRRHGVAVATFDLDMPEQMREEQTASSSSSLSSSSLNSKFAVVGAKKVLAVAAAAVERMYEESVRAVEEFNHAVHEDLDEEDLAGPSPAVELLTHTYKSLSSWLASMPVQERPTVPSFPDVRHAPVEYVPGAHCAWPRHYTSPTDSPPAGPRCAWPREEKKLMQSLQAAAFVSAPTELVSGPRCEWPKRSQASGLASAAASLQATVPAVLEGGARCAWPRASTAPVVAHLPAASAVSPDQLQRVRVRGVSQQVDVLKADKLERVRVKGVVQQPPLAASKVDQLERVRVKGVVQQAAVFKADQLERVRVRGVVQTPALQAHQLERVRVRGIAQEVPAKVDQREQLVRSIVKEPVVVMADIIIHDPEVHVEVAHGEENWQWLWSIFAVSSAVLPHAAKQAVGKNGVDIAKLVEAIANDERVQEVKRHQARAAMRAMAKARAMLRRNGLTGPERSTTSSQAQDIFGLLSSKAKELVR
eukprot:jgi/Chlat1/2183/Chrsp17S02746